MSYAKLFEEVATVSSLDRSASHLYEKYSTEQRAAILSPLKETAVVCAGAGAGKTTVLIERVARILTETGVQPKKVAVITFTTKAASELRHRLISKLGNAKSLPVCSTVHALALKLLSAKRGEQVPLLSEEATTLMISQLKNDMHDEELIGMSNTELLLEICRAREEQDDESLFGIIAMEYERRLAEYDIADFTSLLVEAAKQEWGCFDYILVDESQDLSMIQKTFIQKLAHEKTRLWFIGDDDQAIYAFRGAGSGVMADLVDRYGSPYILSTNYRSDRKIVHHALSVIKFNNNRMPIQWTAHSKCEGNVMVSALEHAQAEMDFVTHYIENNPDTMVLGRTQAIIAELKEMKLPAMTVHESKGLEFNRVIVIGCESALFPHPLSLKEEERRLFYVAMTRAKHDLIMTYAQSRNSKNTATRQPSPFLFEAQALNG